MIEIDEVVRNKARAEAAGAWLDALPDLVAALADEWSLTVGRSLGGGTEAWVGEVVDTSGRPLVLKLCLPRPTADPWAEARREAMVLDHIGGRGCATLVRSDVERGALLLERLGPTMEEVGLAADDRLRVLAGLATELWRPVEPESPLATALDDGRAKAAALVEFATGLWEELDRPCSARVLDHAVAAAESRGRAHRPDGSVLVHGDVHQWNALQTLDGDGWRLVDPDGLVAEPAYDLGVILREDPEELVADLAAGDPRRRARLLGEVAGVDPVAIEEWATIERVSTGLLATQIELQPVGRELLAAAEQLARYEA